MFTKFYIDHNDSTICKNKVYYFSIDIPFISHIYQCFIYSDINSISHCFSSFFIETKVEKSWDERITFYYQFSALILQPPKAAPTGIASKKSISKTSTINNSITPKKKPTLLAI